MKSHILFLIVIFYVGLFGQHATAQGLCDIGGGAFHVNQSAGCAPLKVDITNDVAGASDIYYVPSYNGTAAASGLSFVNDLKSYTYANAGQYILLQKVGQQYACEKITVYESRPVNAELTACGGGSVILSIISDGISKAYDRMEVDWGDGSDKFIINKGESLMTDHTYTDPSAKYTIRILGYYDNMDCKGGRLKELSVTFVRPELSKIRIRSVEMTRIGKAVGKAIVNYFGVVGVSTDLMYSSNQGASFVKDGTKNQGENVRYTYEHEFDLSQTHVLKLQSSDLCKNSSPSATVTTMSISGTASDEETNNIQWSRYPVSAGFTHYELLKDGEVIETFTDITKTSYVDEDVICGNPYEYRIRAVLEDVTSISAPIDITTKTSTVGLQSAKVSVITDNTVEISVELPGVKSGDGFELSFARAEAGSTTFKRLPTLAGESTYLDKDLSTNEKSYCYRITYTNACRNVFPPVGPICTILLNDDKLPNLSWSEASPILEGVGAYEMLENSKPINVGSGFTFSPDFSDKNILEYTFQVQATSPDGKLQSLSNMVDLSRNVALYIPDAFTPNEDEFNSIFEVKGNSTLLSSFKMIIFNRWGKPVFVSDRMEDGWDGTIEGSPAPEGSYIYTITYGDYLGQTVKKNGTFMLLR
jgi:gliding motility-associated-like protein